MIASTDPPNQRGQPGGPGDWAGPAGRRLGSLRQRAGAATLLVVAALHVCLLAHWSGWTVAGTPRAWPVSVTHPAVVRVVAAVRPGEPPRAHEAADDATQRVAPAPAPSVRHALPSAPEFRVADVDARAAAVIPLATTDRSDHSAAPVAQTPLDAGEGADEPTAYRGAEGSLPSAPLPLYATRMPAPALLRYTAQMGARRGQAELDWQHDGQQYRLQLSAAAPGGPAWQQSSSGAFDGAGLAPERFVDRRGRRAERAANFQRETGRISFSGPAVEYPLVDGAQDRLGFIVQLAAICSAAANVASTAASQVPQQIALFVVDARGLGDVWTFTNQGVATIDGPQGTVSTVYLVRENQRQNDWRVEAWLDPQRGFWPARLRMTVARTGAVFELNLAGDPQPR